MYEWLSESQQLAKTSRGLHNLERTEENSYNGSMHAKYINLAREERLL